MKLKAIKVFRDKTDSEKLYKVGDILNIDDLARVNDLVSRGLCEIITDKGNSQPPANGNGNIALFDKEFELQEVKDALIAIGIPVHSRAGMPAVIKSIAELSEEQTDALKEILCKQ